MPVAAVDKVWKEFSKIPRSSKGGKIAEFDTMLEKAFAENKNCLILNRKKDVWPLNDAGGKLLGDFIRRHPTISEIHIPNHQIRSEGWGAFVDALAETKHLGHLQVLDVSFSSYTPEMLQSLGEKVLCDHPSLRTLHLGSSGLDDDAISSLVPHLRMPSLQTLILSKNSFDGECLAGLVEQLKESCPKLVLLNLQTCQFSNNEYSPLLLDWLDINSELCIMVDGVGYEEIYNRSMRNKRENFIPNRFVAMEQAFTQLFERYSDLHTRLNALEGNRSGEDSYARQRVKDLENALAAIKDQTAQSNANMMKTLSEKIEAATKAVADSTKKMVNDIVKEMLTAEKVQEMIASGQVSMTADLETMKKALESTRQDMSLLIGQMAVSSAEQQRIEAAVLNIQDDIFRMDTDMDELKEMQQILKDLVQKFNSLPDTIWTAVAPESSVSSPTAAAVAIDSIEADYTPTQLLFLRHFRRVFIQVHLAASVIHTGFVSLEDSSRMNTASKILTAFSSAAPMGAGIGLQVVAFCLQNASNQLVKKRLDRVLLLGETPEYVSRVAHNVGKVLMPVLMSLDNPVKSEHLKKVFDAVGDLADTANQYGFFGALAHLTAMTSEEIANQHNRNDLGIVRMSDAEAIQRAERDAQLLVALLMSHGVPLFDGQPHVDSLVFLGLPWLAIANRVYEVILDRFCVSHQPPLKVSVAPEKRDLFHKNLMQAWQTFDRVQLTRVVGRNAKSMDDFAVVLGETYFAKHSAALHFKAHNFTTSSTRHLSWNKDFLTPEIFSDILRDVMASLPKA